VTRATARRLRALWGMRPHVFQYPTVTPVARPGQVAPGPVRTPRPRARHAF